MITDGLVYSTKLIEDDNFVSVDVTADNYQEEYAKGLYIFEGFTIPYGIKTLAYIYKHPNGIVIDKESISIVYDGEQGAQYLGIYANASAAESSVSGNIADGDYYLNSTDGYIYYANKSAYNAWTWVIVTDYTDERYSLILNSAISKIDELSNQTQLLAAFNIWAENLVAKTAFIQKLFSKQITLQTPAQGENSFIQSEEFEDETSPKGFRLDYEGVMQSANYDGTITDGVITDYGTNGWAIDKTGKSDFTNINATGGTFTDVDIDGAINIKGSAIASNLSLSGFKAGDVILRNFGDYTDTSTTSTIYSQICGTGVIRIKFKYRTTGSSIFGAQIKISTADLSYMVTGENTDWEEYTQDIPITEGDSVCIVIANGGGGVAAMYYTQVKDLQICTNGACGILAYLGSVNTSSKADPSR